MHLYPAPSGQEHVTNKMNPGYFPLAATHLKPQQIPMFLHISAPGGGALLH